MLILKPKDFVWFNITFPHTHTLTEADTQSHHREPQVLLHPQIILIDLAVGSVLMQAVNSSLRTQIRKRPLIIHVLQKVY